MSAQPPSWVGDYIGREFDRSSWHCWELCRAVAAKHLGMEWPSFDWADGAQHGREIREQSLNWQRLCLREEFLTGWRGEALGDIAVIRIGTVAGHVGMIVAPNRMIHVEEDHPTSLVEIRSQSWRLRVEGVYRWIG